MKTLVIKNFEEFTEKCLCHHLFFNKVASWWPANLCKRRLQHRCFPVNFAEFSRTPPGDFFWDPALSSFIMNSYSHALDSQAE